MQSSLTTYINNKRLKRNPYELQKTTFRDTKIHLYNIQKMSLLHIKEDFKT